MRLEYEGCPVRSLLVSLSHCQQPTVLPQLPPTYSYFHPTYLYSIHSFVLLFFEVERLDNLEWVHPDPSSSSAHHLSQ